jgi:hypothetical protein
VLWLRSYFYKVWVVFVFMRIRFLRRGGQRRFLDLVIESLRAPSLRGLLQFGFDVRYSALKSYYEERRLMSRDLVLEMCSLAGLSLKDFEFEELGENWGRVLGGRKGKRK